MEKTRSTVSTGLLAARIIAASVALFGRALFPSPVTAAFTENIRATISGVVKDERGKPLRGARITATAGYRSVSRFTDPAGHYKIVGLKPDHYEITATAWGFEQKQTQKELSGDAEMNFSIAPQWDPNRLTTAEWISAYPQDEDFLKLQAACMRCHTFSFLIKDRGMTAAQWTSKILAMGDRWVTPRMSKETAAQIAVIAEKYFGPHSSLPTRERVRHIEISDAALRSTVWEYTPPTKSMIHSIKPDLNGQVWFTEVDKYSGKLGRLDIASEKIQEFSMPAAWRAAQEPWVGRDGRVWLTEQSSKGSDDTRLGEVDPRTGKITDYATPEGRGCGSDLKDDAAGNIWCIAGSIQLAKFDPRTKTFQYFDVPKPPAIPEIYYRTMWVPAPDLKTPWSREEAKTMSPVIHGVATDSHNNVWYCLYDFGYLGRLDPKTGKSKLYRIPGAGRIKGMEVDENDLVWFGDFLNHKLDRLDPSTGKVEEFLPPTPFAAFYGQAIDKKGNIWLTDFNGSQITKFHVATKQFTEYPLPRPDVMGRFFGLDAQGRAWYGDTNGKFGALDPGDSGTPSARKVSAMTNK
jgi:streptogramin lyase